MHDRVEPNSSKHMKAKVTWHLQKKRIKNRVDGTEKDEHVHQCTTKSKGQGCCHMVAELGELVAHRQPTWMRVSFLTHIGDRSGRRDAGGKQHGNNLHPQNNTPFIKFFLKTIKTQMHEQWWVLNYHIQSHNQAP